MKLLTKMMMLLLAVAMIQACDDILNEPQPDTDISEEQALNNSGTIESMRVSMYSSLHGFDYTTEYMLTPEALADNTFHRADAGREQSANENQDGVGVSSWGSAYELINKANLMIHAIPEDEDILPAATRTQYQGEAYFFRAFAMHHLARALAYEPDMWPGGPNVGNIPVTHDALNGWNHGIIVRTEPVRSVTDADFRPRLPVSEVYQQIRDDLNQAIDLLGQQQANSSFYVQQAAAYALLARVELYDRNYQAAEDAAANAISATSATLASPAQVPTMFNETSGTNPEGIFILEIGPTEDLGVNNALAPYTNQVFVAQVPTQSLMDLYSSDDARLAWYEPCVESEVECRASHPEITGGHGLVKSKKWAAEADPGQYNDNIPYFRVAEMKLIQAEARLNGASGLALTPFNELRQNRNLAPVAAVSMDDILDERRREFAFEGQRYWDLKRLGRDIPKDQVLLDQFPEVDPPTYGDFRILDDLPTGEVVLSQDQAEPENVLLQNPGHE